MPLVHPDDVDHIRGGDSSRDRNDRMRLLLVVAGSRGTIIHPHVGAEARSSVGGFGIIDVGVVLIVASAAANPPAVLVVPVVIPRNVRISQLVHAYGRIALAAVGHVSAYHVYVGAEARSSVGGLGVVYIKVVVAHDIPVVLPGHVDVVGWIRIHGYGRFEGQGGGPVRHRCRRSERASPVGGLDVLDLGLDVHVRDVGIVGAVHGDVGVVAIKVQS